MTSRILNSILMLSLLFLASCQTSQNEISVPPMNAKDNLNFEKAAILKTINDETKAAFNRNYEAWQDKWIHDESVTKTYMDFRDNSMSETLGWAEINDFVKTYIEEHPEPAPIPSLVDDIEVRLYGTGAWVSYTQNDAERGLKRETRLMEKVNNQWKIAGMQTVIYGIKE